MSDLEPTPPGDAVDPDVNTETDLSDFEAQVVEQFNAREAQSSAASDEDSAEASPSPGSEAAAPANTGAALDFIEPVDETDAPVDEQPAEPAVQQELWGDYDDTQQAQARSVYDWYTKLDETAISTVDAALSGDYVLVPVDQVETLQNNWDLMMKVAEGGPEAIQQAQREAQQEMYGDLDPEDPVAQEMVQIRQRLEEFEDQQAAKRIEQNVNADAERIDQTFNYWMSQHDYLTPEDATRIQNWVVQSGVFQSYVGQHGVEQATLMALDQALFNDSELRMKAVQPMVDQRVQQELLAAQEQAQRGMRASAVAGSSSSEPDSVTMSPEEAMIEEIRRSLEGM